MYKKCLITLLTAAVLALTSCQANRSIAANAGKPNSQSYSSTSYSSSRSSATPVFSEDSKIITAQNYLINDQISVGKNSDIIIKQGIFKQKVPTFKDKSFYNKDADFLGMDSSGNIIIDDYDSAEIDSVDNSNKVTMVLNYMGNRKNHVFSMSMCGNIVAWTECPYGNIDPAEDTTRGAEWGVYFADLKTKKITKIDQYKKITVPRNAQYSYMAPNEVNLSPDHISYVCWDYAPDGSIKPVIKLYTISTENLTILDYLAEDVSNHGLGYPYISDNKMVWCKAKVNADGTYTGYSILYDLKTKVRSKLFTNENIINPLISGNYIFASGQPNKTFYDSEICIYDIAKNQWVYKINNSYSQYKKMKNDYLTDLQSIGGYLVWSTGSANSLVLFNKADNKLYNIVPISDKRYITNAKKQGVYHLALLATLIKNYVRNWL